MDLVLGEEGNERLELKKCRARSVDRTILEGIINGLNKKSVPRISIF